MKEGRFDVASCTVSFTDEANGDSHYFGTSSDGRLILAVADGVGSTENPGLASRVAVDAVVQQLEADPKSDLLYAFRQARQALVTAGRQDTLETTLSVCVVRGDEALVGHVGDSRVYHIRGTGIATRTKDQTEVQRLIDEGVLSPLRALRYPRKKVLLSALSSKRDFDIQLSAFDVRPHDLLVLLTDGAYSLLTKRSLVELWQATPNVTAWIGRLDEVLKKGGVEDDATVVAATLFRGSTS